MGVKLLKSLCPGDILMREYPTSEEGKIRKIEMGTLTGWVFHFKGYIVPEQAMKKIFENNRGLFTTKNNIDVFGMRG